MVDKFDVPRLQFQLSPRRGEARLTTLTRAESGLPSARKCGSLPKKAAGKPGLKGAALSNLANCSVVKVILSDYLVSKCILIARMTDLDIGLEMVNLDTTNNVERVWVLLPSPCHSDYVGQRCPLVTD